MRLKNIIYAKGYRVKWLAEKMEVNYNSFRTYLNNEDIMPSDLQKKLREFLR